jgi:hypothetical protein
MTIFKICMISASALALSPIISAGSCLAQEAPAADKTPQEEVETVRQTIAGMFVSENPTFALMGVAAKDVMSPETPREFAVNLLNSLDQQGNLQQGFAMEFVPALLFAGNKLTAERYSRMNGLQRSLVRLQIGVGMAKGAEEEDRSVKGAVGFVWQPINGTLRVRAKGASRVSRRAWAGRQ